MQQNVLLPDYFLLLNRFAAASFKVSVIYKYLLLYTFLKN